MDILDTPLSSLEDRSAQLERSSLQIFYQIDTQVKKNLAKVLAAFRDHRVGTHHFASVSGYGHDDLGRETLDKVFAQIVEAEAAAVRVQFVSGTHAIACALFGVLRPGDEMLAIAGPPYDTLRRSHWHAGQWSGLSKGIWHSLPRAAAHPNRRVNFDSLLLRLTKIPSLSSFSALAATAGGLALAFIILTKLYI